MSLIGYIKERLRAFYKLVIVMVTPILLIPVVLEANFSVVSRCAYTILLMSVYWVSEALPIGVTALLPLVMFPLLGVAKAGNIASHYINDTSMLFLGGMVGAIAVENWNLHQRIALNTLLLFGTEPKRLLIGLMLTTWFLSMWISNTATTSMMLPIADAILRQLKESDVYNTDIVNQWLNNNNNNNNNNNQDSDDGDDDDDDDEEEEVNDETRGGGRGRRRRRRNAGLKKEDENQEIEDLGQEEESEEEREEDREKERLIPGLDEKSRHVTDESPLHCIHLYSYPNTADDDSDHEYQRLCKAVYLAIAYSANTGGTATMTGTGPNLVLKAQVDILYSAVGLPSPINFANWMLYAAPLSFINLTLMWCWLVLLHIRQYSSCCCLKSYCSRDRDSDVKSVVKHQKMMLGPLSYSEILVATCFVTLAVLWVTYDLQGFGGWRLLFKPDYVSSTTPSIFITVILFILPTKVTAGTSVKWTRLLQWKTVEKRFCWEILLVLGGGFAIAEASATSGLSSVISQRLTVFSTFKPWIMCLILATIVSLVTEVTSNTATATMLLPIMAQMSISLRIHPLYLMFPTAIACSYAFILPVATPPNVLAYSTGHFKVIDMVMTGIVINIFCLLNLIITTEIWGSILFDFDRPPIQLFNKTLANITNTAGFNTISSPP